MSDDPARRLPPDPFALLATSDFEATQRRELTIYGQKVELLLLPGRARRQGIPGPDRPPFRPSPMARILAEECLWRGQGMTITANPFPFAERQLLLWAEDPIREASLPMLEMALSLAERCQGTVLLNSTGAAASISRAHLHLISDQSGFLSQLPSQVVHPAYLPEDPELECRICTSPFPGFIHILRGSAPVRARAAHRLLEIRSTPAVNMISSQGQTFIVPRSPLETPSPYFPHALGAAELFGRWCYADAQAFAAATIEDLQEALARCCVARC